MIVLSCGYFIAICLAMLDIFTLIEAYMEDRKNIRQRRIEMTIQMMHQEIQTQLQAASDEKKMGEKQDKKLVEVVTLE